MSLDVEVFIVSYGSAAILEPCLRSVAEMLPDARLALREHHDDPTALAALQTVVDRLGVEARIEHDPTNPGFAGGCNALAERSEAAWFLFLNPDVRLVRWPFDDAPPAPPAVIGADYTEDAADHRGYDYRIRHEVARSWFRRGGRNPNGRGFVSGAAMLVDATSFRTVGGFDDDYFLFYEDIDFCLRCNDAGTPTTVERGWVVEHARGHSTRERWGDALVWSYESACRFHAGRGSPVWAYRLYVTVDAVLRAAVHGARGRRTTACAYLALARRAVSDSVRPRRSRP